MFTIQETPNMGGETGDGFVKVEPGALKRRRIEVKSDNNSNKTVKPQNIIPTKNRFDPLANEEMQVEEASHKTEKQNTSKVRVPPVIVSGIRIDHKNIIQCLKGLLKSPFQIKFVEDKVHMYLSTKDDYEILIEYLKSKTIEFHTYTPSWNKVKKIVLKGLPAMSDEQIKKELEELKINCLEISIIKKKDDEMPL